MRNSIKSVTWVLYEMEQALKRLLPKDWRFTVKPGVLKRNVKLDALIKLRAPDQKTATIGVAVKRKLEPLTVENLVGKIRSSGLESVMIAALFLSPRTRELLVEAGASYMDVTGNVRLNLSRPALFVQTDGAATNPWREERPLVSLKGPSSARVIRGLCDFIPPYGIRELVEKAKSSLGSTSRVVSFLEREAILKRKGRGPVMEVDWQALLRRWAEDYSIETSHTLQTFLNPRTLGYLENTLRNCTTRYAVTGGYTANRVVPISSVRLTAIYVENIPGAAKKFDLREVDAGANVILAEPFDSVIFDRTTNKDGIVCVALSQAAVDLMTSPGRGPSEAQSLIRWMGEHENEWRT